MELKRKFFVPRRPGRLATFPHNRIRHGYVAIPDPRESTPVEVGVRNEAGKHSLTVKGGSGVRRSGIEIPISGKTFRSLWRIARGKRPEKVHYRKSMSKLIVELDVYFGKLRGLMTGEVEFNSERQPRAFRPPDWLGPGITNGSKFSNSGLSMRAKAPTIRQR